jgi:hypothetical protein
MVGHCCGQQLYSRERTDSTIIYTKIFLIGNDIVVDLGNFVIQGQFALNTSSITG